MSLYVASAAPAAESLSSSSGLSLSLDSPSLRIISDDDKANMEQVKYHIANEYADFKNIDEVLAFLGKVQILVQKHPRNIAFAQGELKEMHKFLSQESVTKLLRVDTDLFHPVPMGDDRVALAQRAIEEDDLTRKLFGGPMRSLVESRKQQVSKADEGNHKDGNFFANVWCKISGGCHQ